MSETREVYNVPKIARPMTWQEFKDYIDARLKEMGKDGNIPIHYVDISYPRIGKQNEALLTVELDEDWLTVR